MPRFEIVDTLNLLVKGQDSPNPPESSEKSSPSAKIPAGCTTLPTKATALAHSLNPFLLPLQAPVMAKPISSMRLGLNLTMEFLITSTMSLVLDRATSLGLFNGTRSCSQTRTSSSAKINTFKSKSFRSPPCSPCSELLSQASRSNASASKALGLLIGPAHLRACSLHLLAICYRVSTIPGAAPDQTHPLASSLPFAKTTRSQCTATSERP